ncbi:MAG: sulfite exporter TauE/SafE family protein [Rhodobacteraceae bacterium]|uniref:TSUP family transporter n=1 Tax=Albidovulum sp. TaxID=1872424 RepID=UPI001DBAA54A|nr:sulfite exporter TauE/SafE family protein [Paracoccaceae bacterium]MCB2143271.1 sulfite exporter TauE/SafE family protein [Paracoccaceae bacterium]MCB2151379.1 sulfite exporter TauE/SafE family protein [Paracoccaceae bacterium]MCB2158546.1 sulfite exporter TauE/SafE family protein [Paracoccaceae bacterium]HPE24180.1 sulfite exporter TauE/SafE family protein [Albidovulum sp.]
MDLLAEPGVLAAVLAIVFFAGIVQAGLGMGFGLTAAPMVALLDPMLVPAPVLILGFFSSAWVAILHRGQIVWPEVGLATAGRFAGVAITTALLVSFSRDAFTIAFAVLVILAVAMSLAGVRFPFNRLSLVAVAVVSGIMGTITSVGAPPLALVYQSRPPGPSRATLAAFFTLGVALSLGALILTGWCRWHDAELAAVMAPAMIAGLLVAGRFRAAFDTRYRALMLAASGFAGLILLGRTIWG